MRSRANAPLRWPNLLFERQKRRRNGANAALCKLQGGEGPSEWNGKFLLRPAAARGMAWIELHQALPQHRKLLALRDALRLRTPAALGHMCLLWLWALDNAPDGDLSALPPRQLAEICQFNARRAGELAAALRTSGFVDADGRLHDWGDYTGRLIDQRAANRERQRQRRARLRAAAMKESKEDGT
nr:MAG TPA: replisome organizer protein [Caudoviricetes sp.]